MAICASSSSSVISAELTCLSIYSLRTDKLYFTYGPKVDECVFAIELNVSYSDQALWIITFII